MNKNYIFEHKNLTAVYSGIIRVCVSTATINISREGALRQCKVITIATVHIINYYWVRITSIAC